MPVLPSSSKFKVILCNDTTHFWRALNVIVCCRSLCLWDSLVRCLGISSGTLSRDAKESAEHQDGAPKH